MDRAIMISIVVCIHCLFWFGLLLDLLFIGIATIHGYSVLIVSGFRASQALWIGQGGEIAARHSRATEKEFGDTCIVASCL